MKLSRRPALAFATLATTGALLLSACTSDAADAESTDSASDVTTSESSTETVASATANGEASYEQLDLPEVDLSPDYANATTVTLADGASGSDGDGVAISGDMVTITEAGTYVLTGTLTQGQIVVNVADGDVTLVLDDATIANVDAPAIQVDDADNVVLYTEAGTTSTVTDSGTYDDTDEETGNAAIFSTADLFLAGEGTLIVDGGRNDGITSKDSLVIVSGTYDVTAADDGIRGKDSFVVLDGDVTVDAAGDALKSDNEADADEPEAYVGVIWIEDGTFDITSGVDGLDAANQITINGGSLAIDAGDDGLTSGVFVRIGDTEIDITNSYEGIEGALIYLDAGDVTVVSSDDGINGTDGSGSGGEMGGMGGDMGGGMSGGPGGGAGGPGSRDSSDTSTAEDASTAAATASFSTAALISSASTTTAAMGGDSAQEGVEVYISGGTYVLDADGDGLDSNGNVVMTGGTVIVNGPEGNGNGALDFNGTFEITGGSLAASGSAGMAQSPSGGDQGYLSMSFGSTVPVGTVLSIVDPEGELVASFTTTKSSASLVISTEAIVPGETYTVYADATVTGGETVDGLTVGGTLSGGDELGTLSAS
ncbi:carbohydrate-binding domain-containing protein [Demequina zhanjiangensis]|uniref:Carbohydrate-binding domain-containing protein n=1 Tax=Demequina zhanjiangensis TaxID=3051659 RepID=A0ABT8G479_9MICO|nr:carbohydrate-binding domain-containing protein [Demequina sp. SYSU T00b26]MDN4473950.1 carbohydrate-binding domain-containing protein [Demequina sp. SYSU T00b26]